MKLDKFVRAVNYVFLLCTASLFVIGSTYKYNMFVTTTSVALSFCLLGVWLIRGVKIEVPKYFWLYLIFLISLFVHQKIAGGEISFFFLFASAGMYWIVARNLKETINKYLTIFLVIFSGLMSMLYFGALSIGISSFESNSLFLPLANGSFHNHLGDLWAITFVAVFYSFVKKRNTYNTILLGLSSIFIVMSFSRSALISIAAGVGYICYVSREELKIKKVLWFLIPILSLLFIYFGFFKTTLFSRPYIHEGISSVIVHPLGVGVGNFNKVSKESSLAHNIILEIIAGMGVFSAIFAAWIVYITKSYITNKQNVVLFSAIFMAISANFLFDTTYTIPAMIWLFFISLALSFT